MCKIIRILFILILPIVLIFILALGIYIADSSTRSIGFNDLKPVVYTINKDNNTVIGIMDREFVFDSDSFHVIKNLYKKTAPISVKTNSVLKNIIEMIVDQFVQADAQTHQ